MVFMALILVFNADFNTLFNRKRVEKIQMKYTLILQKYLERPIFPLSLFWKLFLTKIESPQSLL